MNCTMLPKEVAAKRPIWANRIKLRDVHANSLEITPDPIIGEVTPSHEVRFVFLDVDGTINHPCSCTTAICPLCVEKLKRILDQTRAKIVLSSTWRLSSNNKRILFQYLRWFGIEKGSVVGQTRDLSGEKKNRTDEIRDWLRRPNLYCNTNHGWNILKWVSLDDMNLASNEKDINMKSRHIQINPLLGLCKTIDVVDRVGRELNKIEYVWSLDNNTLLGIGERDHILPSSLTVLPNRHEHQKWKRRSDEARQVVRSSGCSDEGPINVLPIFIPAANFEGEMLDESSARSDTNRRNRRQSFANQNLNRRTSFGSSQCVRTVRFSSYSLCDVYAPISVELRHRQTLSESDDFGRLL